MLVTLLMLVLLAWWLGTIVFVVRPLRRRWTEWNGRRVFWRAPLSRRRYEPAMFEAGVEYVANYAVEIRRNYPDSWTKGYTPFNRFAEISLEGIDGGPDFRAFGTAPDVARALVADPIVRKGLQQFDDWHDALFIDAEGVRVHRVLGGPLDHGFDGRPRGWRAEAKRLFPETASLALAACDVITALPR